MRSVYEVIAEIEDLILPPGEMKIHKLCYLAQGWHMAWSGESLFPEAIEAWEMGPVVKDVWVARKHNPNSVPDVSLRKPLSSEEARTLAFVCTRYGRMSGKALSYLTHEPHTAWSAARALSRTVIDPKDIAMDFEDDESKDQGWFWGEDWQSKEREASEEITAGAVTPAAPVDEFFQELESSL